jgi:hypothetical protein
VYINYHYDHQPAFQNLAGKLAGFKKLELNVGMKLPTKLISSWHVILSSSRNAGMKLPPKLARSLAHSLFLSFFLRHVIIISSI